MDNKNTSTEPTNKYITIDATDFKADLKALKVMKDRYTAIAKETTDTGIKMTVKEVLQNLFEVVCNISYLNSNLTANDIYGNDAGTEFLDE